MNVNEKLSILLLLKNPNLHKMVRPLFPFLLLLTPKEPNFL